MRSSLLCCLQYGALLLLLFHSKGYSQNLLDGVLVRTVGDVQRLPNAIPSGNRFLRDCYSPTETIPRAVELPEGPAIRLNIIEYDWSNDSRKRRNEYVAMRTNRPLRPGYWYRLKFEMKSAPEGNTGMMGLQVHFRQSMLEPSYLGATCLDLEPQVRGDHIVTPPNQFDYYDTWQEKTEYYQADGGERYLIFGQFCDDQGVGWTNLSGKVIDVPENPWNAVYDLKNFILEEIPPPATVSVELASSTILGDLAYEVLKPVMFPTNSAVPDDSQDRSLQRALLYLQADTSLQLALTGYADQSGDSLSNHRLSERRVSTVSDYFIRNGVKADRLVLEAKGSTEAFRPELGEAFMRRDRKVEFRFMYSELADEDVELLKAFARIFGCLRYFYPNPDLQHLNWNAYASFGVNSILLRDRQLSPAAVLRKIVLPLAPDVMINRMDRKQNEPRIQNPAWPLGSSYWTWQHHGLESDMNEAFASTLLEITEGEVAGKLFEDVVPGGTMQNLIFPELGSQALIPLTISTSHLPDVSIENWNNRLRKLSLDKRTSRIASAIMVWNVITHFYPYLEKLEVDWEGELGELLRLSAKFLGEEEFVQAMREELACLEDGHGRFLHRSNASQMFPQVEFKYLDDRVFISRAMPDDPFEAGDEVLLVGQQNAQTVFRREMRATSGARQWKIHRAETRLGLGSYGSSLSLTVLRDGEVIEGESSRIWPQGTPEEPFRQIAEGVYYLQLSEIAPDSLSAIIPFLDKNNVSLIVDARGYPPIGQDHIEFISHLLTEADTAEWIYSPEIIYPNQEEMRYARSGWEMQPRSPQLSTPIVFLADGSSLSACESYLSLIQHYRLGTIIGDYTAGANGGANRILLPNGYRFYWTGELVTLPDGTYYHGRGIRPDIYCKPTWETIRSGEDAVLDRAVEYLQTRQ